MTKDGFYTIYWFMDLIPKLLERADALIETGQIAETTLSLKLFNDGKRLSGIRSGKGLTVASYETAMGVLDSLEVQLELNGSECAA